MIYLKNYAAV